MKVLLASRTQNGSSSSPSRPILVVCLTNHALDSFLDGLREAGVQKLVRIGNGSHEDWTDGINLKKLSKEARMSINQWTEKNNAYRLRESAFADIDSWCKGFNARKKGGKMSWHAVQDLLLVAYPEIYHQLVTATDAPYAQAFAFDYWAVGGDLQNLKDLDRELRSRLIHNFTPNDEEEGKVQASVQRVLRQITEYLRNRSTFAGADTIWNLPLAKREHLMAKWASQVDYEFVMNKFASLHMLHREAGDCVRSSYRPRDIRVLLDQNVIGMTTTACASRWDLLKELDLEIMICEEAGEVMEAHTLCALLPTLQHAVFIGDPLQLRPEVAEQSMTLETHVGSDYRLDESLFERFMTPNDPAAGVMPTSNLNLQRRMHPDIADLTRLTYPYLQDHASTAMHQSTIGLAERMFWLDHRTPEMDPTESSKSHVNLHEVAMVVGLVHHLLRGSAYSLGDIAVLTPYNGQLAALHESLKGSCTLWLSEKDRETLLDDSFFEDERTGGTKDEVRLSNMLRIATVDNFQGEEAKIVILTTVRSGGRAGFLKTANRINVACSRARNGFYIIGNSETLQQVPMWKAIIDVFAYSNRIGPALRTCCDRHPQHYLDVQSPRDFGRVQDCQIPCNLPLACGHLCGETCHPAEIHDRIPCHKPCQKMLTCGHVCEKLCYEACGLCEYTLGQQTLPCGHQVETLCSGKVPQCHALIEEVTLPCGHRLSLKCSDSQEQRFCKQQCESSFDCGHKCKGRCGDCTGKKHPPCSSRCDKERTCGHFCRSTCHEGHECPECDQPCAESCPHGSCRNRCNDACDPCVRPCKPGCGHQQATVMLCSLPCDIIPCSMPCQTGAFSLPHSPQHDLPFLSLISTPEYLKVFTNLSQSYPVAIVALPCVARSVPMPKNALSASILHFLQPALSLSLAVATSWIFGCSISRGWIVFMTSTKMERYLAPNLTLFTYRMSPLVIVVLLFPGSNDMLSSNSSMTLWANLIC